MDLGIRVLIGAPRSTSGDLTAEEMRREWEGILALPGVGEIRYCEAPYTDIGALGEAAEGCSAIIGVRVDPSFINERLFAANPQIRYVASLAHGYGDIDMEMTRRHGVTVTNTVYGAGTIAQYTMALLLEICNNVRLHSDYIQKTDWSAGRQRFMYSLKPQIELEGLAFGVVGLGAIGLRAAGMARAFGMEALACSR
ncbi:MAG: hypothetical protein LBJ10_05190, partial [Clostridiales bacterium]|nr:hypothetical protein [Clostridiales bacterium]